MAQQATSRITIFFLLCFHRKFFFHFQALFTTFEGFFILNNFKRKRNGLQKLKIRNQSLPKTNLLNPMPPKSPSLYGIQKENSVEVSMWRKGHRSCCYLKESHNFFFLLLENWEKSLFFVGCIHNLSARPIYNLINYYINRVCLYLTIFNVWATFNLQK